MKTKYEDNRLATAQTARDKAKIHGEAEFSFRYRGQEVWVKATDHGKRVHTDKVRNKG